MHYLFSHLSTACLLLQKLTSHLFLVLLRNLYTLFTVAVPMDIPTTKSIWVSIFVIVVFLMITHSDRFGDTCVFDLYFPDG